MEEIFLRESTIFSRAWKKEDIMKLMKFQKDNKQDMFADEDEEEDKKINIEDYNDLLNEFYRLFVQEEINLLNNDIRNTIEFFYLRELTMKNYISEKFKFNDNRRHSYLRVLDYLLRIQFEGNNAIKDVSNLINLFISEVNESYLQNGNLEDLSDSAYMDKLESILGTKKIPHFLLREGYRIRRGIQNNKDIFIKTLENEKKIFATDDNSTHYSENELSSTNEQEEKKILKNEKYSIKNIIKEIENKEKLPFIREYKEVYIIIFFLSIRVNQNEGIYDIIKNNIDKFIEYFQIDSYKEFEDFKKKYIDINVEEISNEIICLEFSQINESEYLCNYILASYYVLIKKIFNDPNIIYKNLLLFLLNFISNDFTQFT